MEVVLFSLVLLLFEANALPATRVLSYPPAFEGRSNLIGTTSGDFIATLDDSLLYIRQNTSDLKVVLRLDGEPAGIAASDMSAIMPCFDGGDCSYIVDMAEVSKVEKIATPNVAISMSNVDDTYYIASSAYMESKNIIKITKCDVAARYFIQHIKFEQRITNRNFISREFFFNFDDGLYVYFIAIDTSNSVSDAHERRISLMRACHEENATSTSGLLSMFEIELNCGPLNADASIVSFSKLDEMVILGLSGTAGRAAGFCAFNTTAINNAMSRAYDHCFKKIDQHLELPWSQIDFSCIDFSRVSWIWF